MAAPSGNKNALKLKTPEIRAKAYQQYCEHISNGFSKNCFVFEDPEVSVTFETLETYIKTYPVDFPIIHKEIAECKSLKKWEKIAEDMCLGKIRGSNPAVLQMIMRNKFGWDKELKEKQTNQAAVIRLLDLMEKRVA